MKEETTQDGRKRKYEMGEESEEIRQEELKY